MEMNCRSKSCKMSHRTKLGLTLKYLNTCLYLSAFLELKYLTGYTASCFILYTYL